MLVLGFHGGEPPREVKFQGTLVAQADLPPPPPPPQSLGESAVVNTDETTAEISRLLADRPSLTAGIVLLSIGGGLVTSALLAVVLGVAVSGWTGVGIILLAMIGGVVGLVPLLIGAIMLPVQSAKRRSIDAKVRDLRQRSATPPPPVSSGFLPLAEDGLLVATF